MVMITMMKDTDGILVSININFSSKNSSLVKNRVQIQQIKSSIKVSSKFS